MNTTMKTGLAVLLLLAASCKKENSTIQSSPLTTSSSAETVGDITGKYAHVKIGTQVWMMRNLDEGKPGLGRNLDEEKPD